MHFFKFSFDRYMYINIMLKIYHIIVAFLFYLGKPNKLHSIFLNLIDQAHGPKTYGSSRLVSLTLVGQTKDKLVYGLWPWGQLPLRNIKSVVNKKILYKRKWPWHCEMKLLCQNTNCRSSRHWIRHAALQLHAVHIVNVKFGLFDAVVFQLKHLLFAENISC